MVFVTVREYQLPRYRGSPTLQPAAPALPRAEGGRRHCPQPVASLEEGRGAARRGRHRRRGCPQGGRRGPSLRPRLRAGPRGGCRTPGLDPRDAPTAAPCVAVTRAPSPEPPGGYRPPAGTGGGSAPPRPASGHPVPPGAAVRRAAGPPPRHGEPGPAPLSDERRVSAARGRPGPARGPGGAAEEKWPRRPRACRTARLLARPPALGLSPLEPAVPGPQRCALPALPPPAPAQRLPSREIPPAVPRQGSAAAPGSPLRLRATGRRLRRPPGSRGASAHRSG